jgi:hypothetical protein
MTNQTDLNKAELFYKEIIKFHHPDFALAENDPLYEIPEIISIKEQTKTNRSLLQFSTDVGSYDQLLANYFIERDAGGYQTILVKYIFTTNTNSFRIPINSIIDVVGNSYLTVSNQIINPASYELETAQPYQGKYSIQISARAQTSGAIPTVYDGLSPSSLSLVPNSIAAVVTLAQGGADPETNLDAFNRGKFQISVRNLVNDRSIKAKLQALYPGAVTEAVVVGYLEPEMVRDLVITKIPKYQARLFFAFPIALNITTSNMRLSYNSNTSILYVPSISYTITASDAIWKKNLITNQYYVDIDVELVSLGNILGFTQDTPISIEYLPSNGGFSSFNVFTPSFLGSRAQIGFWGDNDGQGEALIHLGSMTDVYIKTLPVQKTLSLYIPPLSQGVIDLPKNIGPVLRLVTAFDEQGIRIPLASLLPDSNNTNYRFSGKDVTKLFVNPGLVGTTIKVIVDCSPIVKTVQDTFDDPLERITNGNTLVRAMFPVYVSGVIQIALEAGISSVTGSNDVLNEAINQYLFTANTQIVKSKIAEIVYQNVPNAKAIVSLDITGTQIYPTGLEIPLLSGDYLKPNTPTQYGISARNTQFVKGNWEYIYIT